MSITKNLNDIDSNIIFCNSKIKTCAVKKNYNLIIVLVWKCCLFFLFGIISEVSSKWLYLVNFDYSSVRLFELKTNIINTFLLLINT